MDKEEMACRLMVSAALADWEVQEEERRTLLRIADELGLDPERAERLLDRGGMQNVSLTNLDDGEREHLFKLAARIVAADEVVQDSETSFLDRLGQALQIGGRRARRLLREVGTE